MIQSRTLLGCAGLIALLGVLACTPAETREPPVTATATVITRTEQVPAEHRTGHERFAQTCAGCHGQWARGTANGPPLLHDLYKPGHHSNRAFVRAILSGTREHHWYFGDMPPATGVSQTDADLIVAYLRWLQKAEDMYY